MLFWVNSNIFCVLAKALAVIISKVPRCVVFVNCLVDYIGVFKRKVVFDLFEKVTLFLLLSTKLIVFFGFVMDNIMPGKPPPNLCLKLVLFFFIFLFKDSTLKHLFRIPLLWFLLRKCCVFYYSKRSINKLFYLSLLVFGQIFMHFVPTVLLFLNR